MASQQIWQMEVIILIYLFSNLAPSEICITYSGAQVGYDCCFNRILNG